MPINVPESVFEKYYDVIDSTFTIFGVVCQLVYIDQVEEISNTYDNIAPNKSINVHRRRPEQFSRENKTYREVEKTEDIKIKVYWDNKNWVKVGGNLVLPDNAIQTIFFATDLPKINRAKELIVHKNIKDLQEMRFKKIGEPFPMGLRQNRYFGCFWERSL